MADSTNLNDIFKAMEEIDLLSEKRKKDKEVLILDKDQEVASNTKLSNCLLYTSPSPRDRG